VYRETILDKYSGLKVIILKAFIKLLILDRNNF